MIDAGRIAGVLAAVRSRRPLVHNITNYVVMNNTANALLALGASPAMVHALEEVSDFVGTSNALVVNIGTLSTPWVASMKLAVEAANARQVPWVLDPVGVGATRFRNETAADLARMKPAAIRGNASEIMALAGLSGSRTRGVDSTQSSEAALDAARRLSRETGAVVAVTGVVDHVTDGERLVSIANGHEMMTRVTGLGCTATALVGAALAVERDRLLACAAGLVFLGVAGEIAAARSPGPGSLQVHLLDALHALDGQALAVRARLG
jgi:hydroxyethylthiazole kinase